MKQSTSFAQVANNLLNVLQGYTKTIRLLLVMFLTLTVTTNAWADYTIAFKSTDGADGSTAQTTNANLISSGGTNVSTISATRAYNGKSGYGIKLGSSDKTGNVIMTLANSAQIKASKLVVKAAYYDSNKTLKVTVTYTDNTTTTQTITPASSPTDYDVSLTDTKSIKQIKIESVTASKGRMYCHSIKVVAASAAPSFTVTATSNNNNYGTVSVSGTTITASPKTGYTYANPAYTVTSGTATVTQNGNTFAVIPSTNCTIQINFTEKVKNTYVDNVQGNSTQTLYDTHSAPSLTDKGPATKGTCEEQHWHFMGWVTEANKENLTDANIVKANTSVKANGTTYYAVWAKGETTGGGDTSKQYSFDITKGDFNTMSYTDNNNSKTSTAKASDNSTKSVSWTSNQVMQQSSTMQWQRGKGYIYNTTDLGNITDVTITSTAGTFTTYYGTSQQPSQNTSVGTGNGYFQIKVGNATGKVSNIKVTFTQTVKGETTTTYSDYITQCTTSSEYTVTFNANGHGTAPDAQTVTSGGKATEPAALTATGYTFGGWYKESECENEFDFNTAITANITLYAKWTPITYTVSFNNNGGTGTMATQTFTYNVAQNLTSNTFTRTGYTFNGWNTKSDGSGDSYANSQSVKNLASTNGATITLYAQWKIQTFIVVFDKNGGTGTMASQTFTYNQAQTLTANTFTRTGYTFNGWNTKADGSGTSYADNQSVTLTTAGLTLYAQWTANTYTVKFDGNGSDGGSMTDQPFTYGQSQSLTANAFTRTNYAFKHWTINQDGTGISYTDKQSVSNLTAENGATVTLYAQWTPIYTITWLANGHKHHSQTNVEGTAIEIPAEPKAATYACDDKVFVGWLDKTISGSTNEEPTFITDFGNVEEDKTYYAVFATAEGTPSTDYAKITNINDLADGNYVIAYSYDGGTQVVLKNTTKNTTQMNGTNLSLSSGIYANPANDYIWQLTEQADGSYYIYNSSVSKYLSATTSALQLSDTPTKYNISYDSSNSRWTVVLNDNSTYYMHGYVSGSSYDFRVSTSGSSGKYRIYLYKNTSTINYSEYVTTCVQVTKYNVTYNIGDGATGTAPTESPKAEGAEFTLASADGLTKEGYSFAGWLCNLDSKTYNAGEEYTMPAKDVTFTAQWNELPKHTVTFYNKGKEYSQVTQTIANAPIECPTDLVACDGYTFAGWSTEELDGVSSFTKIEGEYTPESDISLYAVYAEGNVTTNGWVKVTDLSTITEGTYALLSNNDYAFNGTINNNSDGEHTTNSFVFNGEGVASEAPSGTCEIELIASGDGFKMYSEGKGYLYAKAPKSGNLAWQQNENSSWSWNSTKSNWVYAANNAFLRVYNNTFRTYGNNSGDAAVSFAKKNITSFTTSPACDPMITIGSEAPVMVTSAKDIRVDAVQNITISATNLDQNADKAQVSIKIVSDNSAFKFKEVDANGDGQATPIWTGIANATFDKTLCVTYTPTKAGQEETATLKVTAYRHNGSTEYATATMQVRGRSLPEQFVLVANTGDGWVALPNTLGTGSTASIPYPIAVEVDNDADPTSIPLAPSTTIYKAAARSTVNAIPTGLRFTTETGGYMQASTTEANIWLASNNSENMQSWTLNSTDFVDYSIRVNDAAEGHYLNYNNTQKKIGNYKSDNKLRILPVDAVCEQHAAPEDIEASSVRATSATIQWSAVSTATAGYEYRIGATGEWTKIGNVTELEITGLKPLTNYDVYVRASVEGTNTNCSNEAEVSFTTVNCDDVPTNITHTSSSQSITISWESEAETSTVRLYSDKEGTEEVKSITSSSPCTISDLEKYTTYYVQILAGGDCPSQIIEVSTLIPNINIAEWMTDGILVDVDTDEDVSVIIENEESYGSGTGAEATELFFSKYYEATTNVKLVAIYNGTKNIIDLTDYEIHYGKTPEKGWETNYITLKDFGEIKGQIQPGEELILYTMSDSDNSDKQIMDSVNAQYPDGKWVRVTQANNTGKGLLSFAGDKTIVLKKAGTIIDIIGAINSNGLPTNAAVTQPSWGDANGWTCATGLSIADDTQIGISTNRCLLIRNNTVTSGENAVTSNIDDFVTLCSEWKGAQVPDSDEDNGVAASCENFAYVGTFDYSEYYTKYNTVGSEQVFPGENRTDGTVKITIEGLPNYSCHNIKLNLKIGEDLKLTEITKVPILISDKQTTKITSSTFTTLKSTLGVIDPETKEKTDLTDEQLIEKCETCDIVVLANGKLTHETDGIDQFRDLTIYPEGTFHNNDSISVDRLLVHAKRDEVGCAIIENEGVTLTTNAIAHTKRIDAQYWYPFSLPYNCNIADITQANGESLGTYGVHWGIQYYDGKKRQESGTSAGIGQSSNFWTPIYNSNEQLKAYQGYMIALFDASVSSPTEMRTIYFPPVSEQMYTESGTDSKETTITSWNVNLSAEKRHHGWNFTGSPYISVFNPQATDLTEDLGLISEVLMKSGYYDPETNEYLYDDNNVYVSVPSPNGAKYYDQYITSATSLKPFTAYFVQAIDPKSGEDETQTLAYAKACRELPSSAPRRSTSTRQRVLVELDITAPDGQTDNTGVWVDECYTPTYEIAADLTKMYVADSKPQLYTLDSDNEKMAYNAIPDASAENIPLGLYAPVGGNYTLALNNRVSRLQGAETVELLYNDNVVANLFYEDYVITADKGIVNGYSLRIRRRTMVDSAIDNITGQIMHIINEDGILTIEGIATDAQVSVYDMLGRLVAVQSADGKTNISMPIMTQGVYNVVVGNDYGKTTVKVVLK